MKSIYIISEKGYTGNKDIAYTTSQTKAFEYIECLYSANNCTLQGYLPGKYYSDKKWCYLEGTSFYNNFPKKFFRDNMFQMTFLVKNDAYTIRKEVML